MLGNRTIFNSGGAKARSLGGREVEGEGRVGTFVT